MIGVSFILKIKIGFLLFSITLHGLEGNLGNSNALWEHSSQLIDSASV